MARLRSVPSFVGTEGDLVIYKRWEQYFLRTKSTLSGDRVKAAPEFKRSMESAAFLSRASKIASSLYRELPNKNFQIFKMLTGSAMRMLKKGMNDEEVKSTIRGLLSKV